ncbi:hypothetical protein A2863_00110 [Candidatus Woesebacteria bacterium RIFCSPHIGHO2_01_FULL_38_9b]|uniref:PDZ domain-containing protein n=1 Tax=Candidatus Woesebacteria bacterium RIFCSPHIGHO2_01_FULL_38_9b TaxID=1802493 RepID=A0A1F7Y5F0_9BACT|nr:MAG: hypothetical protein A2863_00110 [Candidatus Woesebacteria bacterium RIFCSPHIGHO2_01_FULL_38_9b]
MISSVIAFILVLSVLILVHEFGHFIMARRAGVWVEEFGFGLPPRVLGKKFGDTIYSINLLPFGGFVRLHGENTEDSITNPDKAFLNKGKFIRSKIILAGVVMNFILAVFCFSLVYTFSGIPRESQNVKVLEIRENSPAAISGLKIDDIVRKVDEVTVTSNDEFIESVDGRRGKTVVLTIERDGNLQLISVMPRENPPESEGALGVVISSTEVVFPPLWKRPFLGVYNGFKEAWYWGSVVIQGFIKMFSDLFGGVVPKDVAGPVGIFALTTQAAKFGILALLNFIGILSVNLAILNVIPFPALDGGRLLFVGIESLFGRKVVPRIESTIHMIGMVILIILIIAITAHDIQRLISAGGVTGYIESVFK